MKDPRKIIQVPLTTEKGSILREKDNKYIFQVDMRANRLEIKKAVEEIFKVKVDEVTTLIMHGKTKRFGRYQGKRPDWKKAIVKLKPGETIAFFETV